MVQKSRISGLLPSYQFCHHNVYVASLALLLLSSGDAQAEPHIPASDDVVLERLPAGRSSPEGERITALRRQLAASPTDVAAAVELAWIYWERGRSELDPRYLGYAQAALAPWWGLESPPPEVLLVRARTRGMMHNFEGALADLDLLLARDPQDADALAARATMLRVLGRLDEAQLTCSELVQVSPTLGSVVVATSVMRLKGAAPQSEQLLRRSLMESRDVDSALRAFALVSLGEISHQLGATERARAWFEQGIAQAPADAGNLRTYADFLLDVGGAPQVVALLEPHQGPDALLLRLVIAARALPSPPADLPVWERALADRMAASQLRGDNVHLQEASVYALKIVGDIPRALALARQNWQLQREPADARALLEAALAARDPGAVAPVLEWMDRYGVRDVSLDVLRAELVKEGAK